MCRLDKEIQQTLEGFSWLLIGFVLIGIAMFAPLLFHMGYWSIMFLLVGGCLLLLGVCELFTADGKPITIFKRLRRNNKGLAWIWIESALAIALCPLIYWCVGWAYDLVSTAVLGMYTFTGTMGMAVTAVQVVISYLMSFCLIFIVIHAWVNAKSP